MRFVRLKSVFLNLSLRANNNTPIKGIRGEFLNFSLKANNDTPIKAIRREVSSTK